MGSRHHLQADDCDGWGKGHVLECSLATVDICFRPAICDLAWKEMLENVWPGPTASVSF